MDASPQSKTERLLRVAVVVAALGLTGVRGDAQQRWKLVEELRITGGEDAATTFNDIRQVDVDAKGNVYALDAQTMDIRVFDASGRLVRIMGRRGQGPGELSQPNGLIVARDGVVWVNDVMNHRLTAFGPDGEFARQVLVPFWGYGWMWERALDDKGRIVEPVSMIDPSGTRTTRERTLRRFASVAGTLDTVALAKCERTREENERWTYVGRSGTMTRYVGVPFAPQLTTVLDPSGGVWCGSESEYEVRLLSAAGTPAATIRGSAPRVSVTARERDSAVAAVGKLFGGSAPSGLDFSKIPALHQRFDGLAVDDKGRLWVFRRTDKGQAIDIWSRNGVQIATLEPSVPFARYRPLAFAGDKVYAVFPDDDGVPVIVRYRIQR